MYLENLFISIRTVSFSSGQDFAPCLAMGKTIAARSLRFFCFLAMYNSNLRSWSYVVLANWMRCSIIFLASFRYVLMFARYLK